MLDSLEGASSASVLKDVSPYATLSRQSNEIRLVRILSDGTSHDFDCRLESFPLAEVPKFTAISYRWGNPDRCFAIFLNGERFLVSRNLMRLLLQLGALPAYRQNWFWIDALCINQRDEVERTHQVGLMANIYSQAEQVIAWLGPASRESSLAMTAMIRSGYSALNRQYRNPWWKSEGAAIRRFCTRGYWRRLWVVQELVLAQEVVLLCGPRFISWERFQSFFDNTNENLSRYQRVTSPNFKTTMASPAVAMIHQVQLAKGGRSSLIAQMEASKHLRCSDPRDKVYALLGIVEPGEERIEPDYTLSLATVLNAVLRADSAFRALQNLAEIKHWCEWLVAMNGISLSQLWTIEGESESTVEERHLFPLVETPSGIPLWWAGHNGLANVEAAWWAQCNQEDQEVPTRAFLDAACIHARSTYRFLWDSARKHGEHPPHRQLPLADALPYVASIGDISTCQNIIDVDGLRQDCACCSYNERAACRMQLHKALLNAVVNGHLPVCRSLLSLDQFNIDYSFDCKRSVFQWAIDMGLQQKAQQLLGSKGTDREFLVACTIAIVRSYEGIADRILTAISHGHGWVYAVCSFSKDLNLEALRLLVLCTSSSLHVVHSPGTDTSTEKATMHDKSIATSQILYSLHFVVAIERGFTKSIQQLLQEKLWLNMTSGQDNVLGNLGLPLLLRAVHRDDVDFAKVLLLRKTDLDTNDRYYPGDYRGNWFKLPFYLDRDFAQRRLFRDPAGSRGETALSIAVRKGSLPMVELLLEHGINVNATSDPDETALSIAVHEKNLPMIELLLDRGSDVNATSGRFERTPLEVAIRNCRDVDITKALLRRPDADPNYTDRHGQSLLYFALDTWRLKTVTLLLQDGRIRVSTRERNKMMKLRPHLASLELKELLTKHISDFD